MSDLDSRRALTCSICHFILDEIIFDRADAELRKAQISHEHELKIITIPDGVLLDHLLLLPEYRGYKLAEIR